MKTQIENRYECCGFVYVGDTRMVFAPRHTVTRKTSDKGLPDLAIRAAQGWPDPNKREIKAVIDTLAREYPMFNIYANTDDGSLVPVYTVRVDNVVQLKPRT